MTHIPPLVFSVTCPVELENALQRELDYLHIPARQMGRGFAEIEANLETAYRLVMWSRVANRVLLPVLRVPFVGKKEADKKRNEEIFYDAMKSVNWERWCEPHCTLAIQWTLASGEHHGQFFMYRLKDAICDYFKDKCGERPSVDTNKPDIVFHLLLTDKDAAVYLDLGGGSLHRRGYRAGEEKKYQAAAPLKENLAAALLYLADWHHEKQQALFDPLCGSGTLLIEAALMRAARAPGLLACGRRGALPCPGWLQHDVSLWKKIVSEAEQSALAADKQQKKIIYGLDGDKQAIAQTLQGATLAQVGEWIHVERREAGQLLEWPRLQQLQKQESLLVITNPPYGERLGSAETVPYLYQNLGHTLQQALPGKTLALICGSKQQARACGVQDNRLIYRQRVHNGPIGCDFSVSTIVDVSVGATPVVARADTRSASTETLQLNNIHYDQGLKNLANTDHQELALSLLNRMRKNAKSLQKWINQENIECYRIYDADIPELNVAIDIYRNHLHVQEYAAPSSVDEKKAEQRFTVVKDTLEKIFPEAAGIHCKVRRRQKTGQQYGRRNDAKSLLEVREGKIKLLVNLEDYLDTGLFLDHRPIRMQIEQQSKNKRFLNLFCYTGVATLHAAIGGAKNTVSVDLSPAYIQWAKTNLALNGFSESSHRFIQADVMSWLSLCRDQFDLIFIDPPTFSNSKRSAAHAKVNDFDVQKDHVALIDMAMKRLEPGGQLIFSNNFRRFILDEGLVGRYQIEEITAHTIPPDFCLQGKKASGKSIHRCWTIQHRLPAATRRTN